MSVLSRLSPSKVVLLAATLLIAGKFKARTSRTRFLISVLLGYIAYTKKAPPIIEGANPPGNVKAYPWVGHLYMYPKVKDRIHEMTLQISRETNFKTFSFCMPDNFRMLVLHDEEDRKYFFKTHFTNYNKNFDEKFGFDKIFPELLGGGIFAVDGDEWKTHRKVAANLFTGRMIGVTMAKTFAEHAEMLRDALLKFADEGKTFDIQLLLQSLIFDAFCFIAFGESPNSFQSALKGEKEEFQVCFDHAQTASALRGLAPPAMREFLKFFQLGKEAGLSRSLEKLDEHVYRIVKRRKKAMLEHPEDFEDVTDILGLYLDYAKRKNRPEILDDVYLRDMIMNFMIAGRDTTSYVLTNILSLIAENPEVDAKVMKELSTRMSNKASVEYAQTEVKNFPLADAIFNEALRMYPSVGTDFRFAMEDDVLPSGIKVPKGTTTVIPNYAIGRNPKYNEKPDSFMPERWLKEVDGELQCERIDEFKYPFFWGGYRLCLGKDMARMEAKVFLGIILKDVKLSMVNPREELFTPGPVMFYEKGMFLQAQRRSAA